MSARRRRHHLGFTLSELMIAVAIVGVLVTLAVSILRAKPAPVDVASQVSSKLAEASRKAAAYGAVRGDVAAALGSRARTRVVFTVAAAGTTVSIERLEEDAAPSTAASWVELSTVKLDASVSLAGYTPSAVLNGGGAPAIAIGTSGTFEVRCNPEGTCTGITVYLTNAKGTKKARVVILPLGGTPMTFDAW